MRIGMCPRCGADLRPGARCVECGPPARRGLLTPAAIEALRCLRDRTDAEGTISSWLNVDQLPRDVVTPEALAELVDHRFVTRQVRGIVERQPAWTWSGPPKPPPVEEVLLTDRGRERLSKIEAGRRT